MKKVLLIALALLIAFPVLASNNKEKKQKDKDKYVKLTTQYGSCVIRLYPETPLHSENFVKLAKEKFFDSTLFHRVIKDFMIQGGDPDSKRAVAGQMLGEGGPTYTIPAEFNKLYIHKKGVIAAARDNNPTKASSGSQFYIVQGKKYTDGQLDGMEKRNGMQYTPEQRELYKTIGGTPFLDQNYTVFGEVVEGIEMVDAIAGVPTAVGDRPTSDVRMTVKLLKKWKAPKVKPNKK